MTPPLGQSNTPSMVITPMEFLHLVNTRGRWSKCTELISESVSSEGGARGILLCRAFLVFFFKEEVYIIIGTVFLIVVDVFVLAAFSHTLLWRFQRRLFVIPRLPEVEN